MKGHELAQALRTWSEGDESQRRGVLVDKIGVPAEMLENDPDYYEQSIGHCARHALGMIDRCEDAAARRRAEMRLARCYETCALMRDVREKSAA